MVDFGFVTLSQALFASTRFQKVKGEWNPMHLCFFTSCQAERFSNMEVCLQLHTNMKLNHDLSFRKICKYLRKCCIHMHVLH